MSLRKTYSIIPSRRRRKFPLVVLSSLLSAIIDLVGIAALVSVLLLVLDENAVSGNAFFAAVYDFFGFTSATTFIVAICLAATLLIVLKGLAGIGLAQYRNRYMLGLYADLSSEMYDNCLRRGLLFIRQNHTTKLINNVNAVCNRFAVGVVAPLLTILTEFTVLLLLTILLLVYNPSVVLLAVAVFVPVTLLYSLVIRRRMAENGKDENRLQVGQNKTMYEALRGYADIEIGNAKPYVSRRFKEGVEALRRCSIRSWRIRTVSSYLVEFALVAGIVAVIIIGITAGRDMAQLKVFLGIFAVAAYRIVPSVSRITGAIAELRRNGYVVDIIDENLAENPDDETSNTERMPFEHEIALQGVSFSYDDGKTLFDNLTLTVRKGEKVGFAGPSGVGKTTLFNIIAALFAPQKGVLTVDGKAVDKSNKRLWQNNIAYVSQDLFLPDDTIAHNIAFGIEPERIDRERLERAVESAQLRALVDSLPDGLETVTGEQGCRLSGGQRQRIGIARALYKEASVMMFDEATSSLDAATEREVVESIEALSRADDRLTILFISHNDKTLSFCDRIVKL